MKRFLVRRLSLMFLVAALALALPAVALADELVVDGDLSTAGQQTVVNLTVDAGGFVFIPSRISIQWGGGSHLAPGATVVVVVDEQNTNLPTTPIPYMVDGVSPVLSTPWDSSSTPAWAVANIRFIAPTTPGLHRYTVKWRTEGEYAGLTGTPALQINLTVPGLVPAGQYTVVPLYDVEKAVAGALPVRVRIREGSANVSSSSLPLKALSIVDSEGNPLRDAASTGQANPQCLFRYDDALQGYIFNLNTGGLPVGSYRLTFFVGDDPTPYSVPFTMK